MAELKRSGNENLHWTKAGKLVQIPLLSQEDWKSLVPSGCPTDIYTQEGVHW